MIPRGQEVHGEVSSADASAGVAFTLYDGGSATARADNGVSAGTLGSKEQLAVTDIVVSTVAGGVVAVCAGTDSAGKRIFRATLDPGGGAHVFFQVPFFCPAGVVPKLFCPAGQVDCQINGFVTGG